ncbi:hypothetical protein Dda_6084 [Drechslerella dactyloides]|uniref:Uncharacterized protein n=1 Tax=Drechslerella dactyloides TaxID=74499 RepID=A0AAD6IZ43_DREDA|nr:hypothetical protein Dda_6084 [Drechslerella dactyloides]
MNIVGIIANKEELQDQTLITSLGLGMIENDFTTPQSDVNIAGVIAGAFGIGAAAAAGSPVVGGPLGAISGIFSIISSVDGDQNNVALSISARLTAAFIASQQQLVNIAEAAFGGTTDTSILRSVSPLSQGTNMERTDIGKFFAGGRWLFPGSRDVGQEVKQVTERATVRMRQALMIQALKTQGMSVIIDSARNKFEECTPTGSRFINSKCYSIGQRLSGRGPTAVIYIPRAQALKLDNSFYQLNVEEFYMNAEACAKANPSGDRQPPSQGFPLDGSLPPCFFNMDVIDGRGFTDQLSAIGPR